MSIHIGRLRLIHTFKTNVRRSISSTRSATALESISTKRWKNTDCELLPAYSFLAFTSDNFRWLSTTNRRKCQDESEGPSKVIKYIL